MSVRLEIRVIPRASRNEVGGMRDGRLVVRVTAPPVDGAANEAVIEILAERLDIPKRSLRVVSGATSKSKTIEIEGLPSGTVLARLEL